MSAVSKVIQELYSNMLTTHRLAVHELVNKNKGNFFGIIWLWLNPMIQILIYAFVFGYGIRNRAPVEGQSFFFWLIPGYIMWNFVNSVVTQASRSVVRKLGIISKMRFPVSITPAIIVIAEFYVHIMMLLTVMIIMVVFGHYPVTKYWLYLPYFSLSAVIFLYAVSIFNSTITMMIRDYQHVVYNTMRMLFFLTPILFPMKGTAKWMTIIMKLNPISYLVEGYRDALVFGRRTVFMSYRWGIYFWIVTIMFFIIGSMIHVKMRKNLLDFK